MTRFYFNLLDGDNLLADTEGTELPDWSSMCARALHTAREMLSEEIRAGRLPLYLRLDIRDDSGLLVYQLSFADAIEVLH